ncbi:MAG: hypothetical protein MPN21_18355 [Thermoanaerobaculia bacterium]|nr:hypothetical protein [Thermoanaerobaculia bacterium]
MHTFRSKSPYSPPAFVELLSLLLALSAFDSTEAQLGPPPEPVGNPLTEDKARLGKALFWDEQLSSTRTVACGTCHIPKDGGDDPRSANDPLAIHPGPDGVFGGADDVFGSPGVPLSAADGTYDYSPSFALLPQVTGRRTISSVNAGYSSSLFWDGRAGEEFVDPVTETVVLASGAALESQALGPLLSDVEMAHVGRTWTEVLDRVAAIEPLALAGDVPADLENWIAGRDYAALFEEAFGSPGITAPRIGMAIASYERTQFTDQTPFDDWLITSTGLTVQELAGRDVFLDSSCDRCHSGVAFTDHDFHYTGVRPHADDAGRFDVTELEDDRARMRTPSLRNVELRAPYMRNGRFATLEDVIEFYNRGGDFDGPNKDAFIRELMLTEQEKADLLAFLTRPLTDSRLAEEQEPFDRPRLYTESWGLPVVYGSGVNSSQGILPRVAALEPPLLGNPNFTVGVYRADGSTEGLLVIDDEDPGTDLLPTAGSLAHETVFLSPDGVGTRHASVAISLPSAPGLEGKAYFGRWYVVSPGSNIPEAVSKPFAFKLFSAGSLDGIFQNGFESGTTVFWTGTP